MNGYTGPSFTTVNLNGNFNGWCGSCATMLDPDQDSIYELDLDLPLSTVEYKFTLDGWAQQESLLPGSPCTMTTGQYTNRFHNVTGNDTLTPSAGKVAALRCRSQFRAGPLSCGHEQLQRTSLQQRTLERNIQQLVWRLRSHERCEP